MINCLLHSLKGCGKEEDVWTLKVYRRTTTQQTPDLFVFRFRPVFFLGLRMRLSYLFSLRFNSNQYWEARNPQNHRHVYLTLESYAMKGTFHPKMKIQSVHSHSQTHQETFGKQHICRRSTQHSFALFCWTTVEARDVFLIHKKNPKTNKKQSVISPFVPWHPKLSLKMLSALFF